MTCPSVGTRSHGLHISRSLHVWFGSTTTNCNRREQGGGFFFCFFFGAGKEWARIFQDNNTVGSWQVFSHLPTWNVLLPGYSKHLCMLMHWLLVANITKTLKLTLYSPQDSWAVNQAGQETGHFRQDVFVASIFSRQSKTPQHVKLSYYQVSFYTIM